MKKYFTMLLITLLIITEYPVYAYNPSNIISSEIIYLTDDLYMEVVLEENIYDVSTYTTQTKSTTKTATIKNNNGDKIATFKLTATFIYDGSSSSCTSVSHSTSITDTSWKFTEATSSKLGSVAYGSFTVKDYLLSMCVQTISDSLTIKCDVNGNIS